MAGEEQVVSHSLPAKAQGRGSRFVPDSEGRPSPPDGRARLRARALVAPPAYRPLQSRAASPSRSSSSYGMPIASRIVGTTSTSRSSRFESSDETPGP